MAVTLTVDLTDQEQTALANLANEVAPNMTAPQLKAWAEGVMKDALRAEVVARYKASRRATVQQTANASYASIDAEVEAEWPEPTEG